MGFFNYLKYMNCLVFISNNGTIPEIRGSIHIARKIKTYDNWTEVILLTDENGNNIENSEIVTVSNDNILSDKLYRDIYPKKIYHFAPLYIKGVIANNFVIKSDHDDTLRMTTENGLGSGINGQYVENIEDISLLKIEPKQLVYEINYTNPLNIQDAEHGDSITIASLATNTYLDTVIRGLKFNKEITFEIALDYINNTNHYNIVNLWNIVFYRDNQNISIDQLDNILANYIVDYFNDNSLKDSITNEIIQELPINYILKAFGYDGIIATDLYNNGWYRGCYCYDYSQATILKGDIARY